MKRLNCPNILTAAPQPDTMLQVVKGMNPWDAVAFMLQAYLDDRALERRISHSLDKGWENKAKKTLRYKNIVKIREQGRKHAIKQRAKPQPPPSEKLKQQRLTAAYRARAIKEAFKKGSKVWIAVINSEEMLPAVGKPVNVYSSPLQEPREARLLPSGDMWQFSDRTLSSISVRGTFWSRFPKDISRGDSA